MYLVQHTQLRVLPGTVYGPYTQDVILSNVSFPQIKYGDFQLHIHLLQKRLLWSLAIGHCEAIV